MSAFHERRRADLRARLRLAAGAVLAIVALGCSPTLVERAIEARGGPLDGYVRKVDATALSRMPGEWTWEIAFRAPETFRWTLETWGESQTISFDGKVAEHRLGGSVLPSTPGAVPAARSQARWLAVTALDVLQDEKRLEWHEIPPAELPAGVRSGIRATYRDDGASYELFFDDEDLLVRARGPIDLSPLGAGRFDAVFGDFRHVDEYRLPWTGTYSLEGQPFFNERTRAWYPHQF